MIDVLINRLHKHGIINGDLHGNNIDYGKAITSMRVMMILRN